MLSYYKIQSIQLHPETPYVAHFQHDKRQALFTQKKEYQKCYNINLH